MVHQNQEFLLGFPEKISHTYRAMPRIPSHQPLGINKQLRVLLVQKTQNHQMLWASGAKQSHMNRNDYTFTAPITPSLLIQELQPPAKLPRPDLYQKCSEVVDYWQMPLLPQSHPLGHPS